MKIYYPEFIVEKNPDKSPEDSPVDFSKACRTVKLWSKEDAEERGKKYIRENGYEVEGNGMYLIMEDTSTRKTTQVAKYLVTESGITKQR